MAVTEKIATPAVPRPMATMATAATLKGGSADDELVDLYRAILRALPDRTCRIIETIAANPGEGVSTVVRGVAAAAAAVGNARVLVCDATPQQSSVRDFGMAALRGTLNDVAAGGVELRTVVDPVPSQGFALCAMADPGSGSHVAVNLDSLDPVLATLREQFDLILIDAPPTSGGPLGPALAKKSDGVILVLEAERTRSPVAAAARRAIEINGGRILGVVLNKRRFHIPAFIYRWL